MSYGVAAKCENCGRLNMMDGIYRLEAGMAPPTGWAVVSHPVHPLRSEVRQLLVCSPECMVELQERAPDPTALYADYIE